MNEIPLKDISSRWFVRYPTAILMIGAAYIALIVWSNEIHLRGMFLLMLNPVMGIVYAVLAMFAAWEISLLLIVMGVGFLVFKGLMALPLSIVIILGAIIIASVLRAIR